MRSFVFSYRPTGSEPEAPRGRRRRKEAAMLPPAEAGAHHRISRRRHLAARPAQARRNVHRARRAVASDHSGEWRTAGPQIEIAPADLMGAVDAKAADLC